MQPLIFRKTWLILLVVVLGLFLTTAVSTLAGTQQSPDLSIYQVKQTVSPPLQVDSADVPSADTAGTIINLAEQEKALLEEPARLPTESGINAPSVLLFDNGPVSSSWGTGVGGADESILQNNSLGMSNMGFQHRLELGYWVADDFTVSDAAGWTIDAIVFFAYQRDSSTTSTMTDVRLRIWDGPPGAGSSVIWGDTTTNVLDDTTWSNIYRVDEDSNGSDSSRPVMYNIVVINHFLPQGTYWLDWQAGGTLPSGPYTPPNTINGSATTGNGLWSTDGGVTYNAALDRGSVTQQGFPFVIHGSVGPPQVPSISLDKTVSTVVGTCPGQDSVSVAPGTPVSYCYEVINTGDITLTLHDLVDSHLGTIMNGFSYALNPGASTAAGTGGITINTTTVSTATWTAYNSGPTDVAADSDTAKVYVPGPEPLVCNGEAATFDDGIPTDWTVVNNAASNPVVWENLTACGESGNFTGRAGEAACASSDLQDGGSGLYDTELWSPPFDLTGVGQPELTFWANYHNFDGSDILDVDISTNGGSTWTNLLRWNEDHGAFRAAPGEMVTLDLLAYIGQPNLIIRWHYYDPTGPDTAKDWYVQVDDVALSCISGPAIELEKTVGLDPSLCNTTDAISVYPGTDVYYCYKVTNTGTVPLDLHNLVDTQFGSIISNFPFTLNLGASAWLTQTTTIQSSIVNTATWTAYNSGPVDEVTSTDTAQVVVSADELVCNGELVEFEFGIPSTFSTIANGPVYWSTIDDLDACDNRGNQTAGFGRAACADGDETNTGALPYDAELWTNPLDLTGPYADALLHFDAAYKDIVPDSESDLFDVDVSTDGGASWTTLQSWNGDHYNPSEAVTLDLSAYLGEPAVIVRFRYHGTAWSWWAHVDQIGLTCTDGYNLSVDKDGSGIGKVTSAPAGIDCGTACDAIFADGTPVTLTATAGIGSTFSGWSGACSGQGECVIVMENNRAVTATFLKNIQEIYLPLLGKNTP